MFYLLKENDLVIQPLHNQQQARIHFLTQCKIQLTTNEYHQVPNLHYYFFNNPLHLDQHRNKQDLPRLVVLSCPPGKEICKTNISNYISECLLSPQMRGKQLYLWDKLCHISFILW